MERTVPSTASEEVELYLRTYYSLLRSSAEVKIRTLEEVHAGMHSLLHHEARENRPDMSAFIYSLLRLPSCMSEVQLVVLGQSAEVFQAAGFEDVSSWTEVSTEARRRRCFYDEEETLACFIASRSDIDDMIPILTAYQIEWNKLHRRLHHNQDQVSLFNLDESMSGISGLAETLEISPEDLDRLYAIWDEDFGLNLELIAREPRDLRVQLLSGSLSAYRRARHAWWKNIEWAAPEITDRPVYFISSNVHGVVNILSGFAMQRQEEIIQFLERSNSVGLLNEWRDIKDRRTPSSRENFLYYVLRRYQQNKDGHKLAQDQTAHEQSLGILRIPSKRSFDVEAQVIELSKLDPSLVDPRLQITDYAQDLSRSDALILNIDYPLGLSAYDILTEVSSKVGSILGVYIMGKAATLNAIAGDVMISNVVHDEHSRNTYLFDNCFSAADVAPNLIYGTVLDNQKAVTVRGTFLQNADFMDVFYSEGYTDIEMEAGPYLSAVYEMFRPKRHPVDEIVNMFGLPFDLGLLHYASDTPLSKGKNLGAGSLSYFGMDSAYAVTLAILRRVFEMDSTRIRKKSLSPA